MGIQMNSSHPVRFRFERCSNLQRKNRSKPNTSVIAEFTLSASAPTKKLKSPLPRFIEGADPEWNDNTECLADATKETKFSFVVLHRKRWMAMPSGSTSELARSRTYTLEELVQMEAEAIQNAKQSGSYDPRTDGRIAIPLVNSTDSSASPGTSKSSASSSSSDSSDGPTLYILLIHSRPLDATTLQKVEVNWKLQHRAVLDCERAALTRTLKQLSSDIPPESNVKVLVDIASGLFASISPLLDTDDLIPTGTSRELVRHLIMSYGAMFSQIQKSQSLTVEDRIRYYGQACVELAQSLRRLGRCLGSPDLLKDKTVRAELGNDTRRFDAYPLQDSRIPLDLDPPNSVFERRAVLRNTLSNASPLLLTTLNPNLAVEPTSLLSTNTTTPFPPATVQYLASWALLSGPQNPTAALWLYAPGGCGKTRLACSLVDAFGRLGNDGGGKIATAYFRCGGPDEDADDDGQLRVRLRDEGGMVRGMIKTVAFQLAAYLENGKSTTSGVGGFKDSVVRAVQKSSSSSSSSEPEGSASLGDWSVAELFENLVVAPLQRHYTARAGTGASTAATSVSAAAMARGRDPVIIILDDLDQCAQGELDDFVGVLVEALPRLPREVRVMMISRNGLGRGALGSEAEEGLVRVVEFGKGDLEELRSREMPRLNGAGMEVGVPPMSARSVKFSGMDGGSEKVDLKGKRRSG